MKDIVVYRIAENEWNLKGEPWSGAIGIEEVRLNDDGAEVFTVPSLICWFSRGCGDLAARVVSLLNSDAKWLDEVAKLAD